MIMIRRLIIQNFKGIKKADIVFNDFKNIIVGNNGVGKSTIIEALSLALGYGLNKLEITPYIFHSSVLEQFKIDKTPPTIIIEVYFDEKKDEFSGTNNTMHGLYRGLQLKICFDEESYTELYELEKDSCTQIPCEYYKIERYWFSDKSVKQLLIPYSVQLVDSSSTYFNSSSNQYITHLLRKYIGDDDFVKIKSCLRHLKQDFEGKQSICDINTKLKQERENLELSIDVTSKIIFRDIICPFLENIPIEQIGAGELCILKTMLSIDKKHQTEKQKIIIIEEPESHLSHTKMYELIRKIEENISPEQTQLIITTHNSFIANKLDLSNLILIENENGEIKTRKIDKDESHETLKFFTKVSNYPTLRLLLCKSAILVEGPTDEMILTYYYYRKYGHHPFDDSIELISVEGVGFKEYVNLISKFQKKIAIITDNDGHDIEDVKKQRGISILPYSISLFTEEDINLNTLEPSFVRKNIDKLQELSDTIRGRKKPNDTEKDLVEYMTSNKTEWAFKLLNQENVPDFNIPDYMIEAINWVKENDR